MPKNKFLSCISSHEKDKVAYTPKAHVSSNSNIEEAANKKFRKAVQLKIDTLEAKTIRDEAEEKSLQACKLIMKRISEINTTQENKKIQVKQEASLSLQAQLQTISLKSQPQDKIEKQNFDHENKARNPIIFRPTDLQQNRLKPVEKLDHTQSQIKNEPSELEKRLAKQREWEEKNINTAVEAKPATPSKIETDTSQESKSIIETIERSKYEEKATNLLTSLKLYLGDAFEDMEFRVNEEICNREFNEQKLQELIDYEKEMKNRFFYARINEIFQTLAYYLDESELDEIKNKINSKYASNDLNEQDLNNVNAYATEKMNFPVEVVHRFTILSTITEEPENRHTLEMPIIDEPQHQLMDELDNLLQGLQEFTKELGQSNFSQPATCRSFFTLSTNSKELDVPKCDNFLFRP
jgi:hypothetical protein